VEKIKAIKDHRWHPEEKYWSFPNNNRIVEKIVAVFEGERINIDPALQSLTTQQSQKENISGLGKMIDLTAKELKLKGYSPKSRKVYLGHIERFGQFYMKDLQDLGEAEVRNYMLHLLEEQQSSHSYVNQAVSARKFFYS
jgi:hypothetical protein